MSQSKLSTQQFSTFARWRPLTEAETTGTTVGNGAREIERNVTLERNKLYSITLQPPPPQTQSQSQQKLRTWKSQGAFKTVFEVDDGNAKVFDDVVAEAIPRVLDGSSCNFFAYGHTGSGKTHTIIGCENPNEDEIQMRTQLGLFPAAAKALFEALGMAAADRSENKGKLGVALSLFELRKNVAFDLLNEKTPCHIRQGADGKTHVRGETEMLDNGKVRVKPIVKHPCWTYEELYAKLGESLRDRSVGSSTVHDQSSRTHAVLELEVINDDLVAVREALYERQAELVPIGKRATDVYLEETMKSLVKQDDGTWKSNPNRPVNQAIIDAAEAEKLECENRVTAAEAHIESLLAAEHCLGGKMIFVDLAGSEYHNEVGQSTSQHLLQQTPQEKQEGRQINTEFSLSRMSYVLSVPSRVGFLSEHHH